MASRALRIASLTGLAAALACSLVACGDGGTETAIARSRLERTMSPEIIPAQRMEFQEGNTSFALDLYRALAPNPGNLFFSPHSISVALAMTYAGARGQTAAEMAETLHFTLPQGVLHAGFNALDLDLAQRSTVDVSGNAGASPPELSIANSTWGDREKTFLPEFLDLLALHYDAGMRLVDFRSQPEAARLAINEWVEEETSERIKNLIPKGVISPATALVLANAIYFKGSWETPFPDSATERGQFRRADGSAVDVPLMHEDVRARYAEVDGLQGIELPYVGSEVAMLVLLPAPGRFEAFETGLDGDFLARLDGAWGDALVEFTLPKFEFESEFLLNETLSDLGMVSAFDGGRADFSGMDGTGSLFVSAVVHKAFVAVDEKGTEAAAATAVVMDESASLVTATMTVDRPFVILIRDIPTGALLFVGRVVDPS